MADPRVKKLKVQTGVVKRIAKEKAMYEKEVVEQAKKLEELEAVSGEEAEYKAKKQREVMEESKQMVPDSKRRLAKAWQELKSLIAEYQAAGDLDQDAEELKLAVAELANAEQAAN